MFKLNTVLRSSLTTPLWRGSVRLLHVGDANILPTSIDKNSDEFKENATEMSNLVNELRNITKEVLTGGGEKAIERHTSRGKLLARERINRLVDTGSPFLELGTLAGYKLYGDEVVNSGGIITGIGRVCGQVVSNLNIPSTNAFNDQFLYSSKKTITAAEESIVPREIEEPKYDPKELYGIVGPNLTKSFDVREVIARIVDGSRFTEFK
ncbi:hypothetical protein DOY81_015407, partial [Sarcophaga bullata]